jgi:hypothetical protein
MPRAEDQRRESVEIEVEGEKVVLEPDQKWRSEITPERLPALRKLIRWSREHGS